MQKGVFIFLFLFLVLCFICSLCFCPLKKEKAPKGYFPAVLEVFHLLSPQKAYLQNPSLLPVLLVFLFSFFPFFPFVFRFKIPFFLPSVHQPLFGKLEFSFLPLPLLIFAWFFDSKKIPNIPFFKTNLLSFLAIFWCFCYCFHVLCFCCSVLCWLCF